MKMRYQEVYDNLPWQLIAYIRPHNHDGESFIAFGLEGDPGDEEVRDDVTRIIDYYGRSNETIPNDDHEVIFRLV